MTNEEREFWKAVVVSTFSDNIDIANNSAPRCADKMLDELRKRTTAQPEPVPDGVVISRRDAVDAGAACRRLDGFVGTADRIASAIAAYDARQKGGAA